jgi:hypothetical protein
MKDRFKQCCQFYRMDTAKEENEVVKSTRWPVNIAFFLIAIYLSSYFLLMVRDIPAYDRKGNAAFHSSYRFDIQEVHFAVTESVGEVTIFNYIYYPCDLIYYGCVEKSSKKTKAP